MTNFDPQRNRLGGHYGQSQNTFGTTHPMKHNAGTPARRLGQGLHSGLLHAGLFVVTIWAVFSVNRFFFGLELNSYGIHPLDPSGLWGIIASPFLHANFEHVLSNSLPGMVFAFFVGFSGKRVFWEVTVIVVFIAGIGTWLFGGVGTNHIGASGLVYGWLGYLLVRGLFNRSLSQILVGVLLGFLYSGLVWGILPGTPGVSWQGHLFGALGGVAAGMFITSDDPPKLRDRKKARAVGKARPI